MTVLAVYSVKMNRLLWAFVCCIFVNFSVVTTSAIPSSNGAFGRKHGETIDKQAAISGLDVDRMHAGIGEETDNHRESDVVQCRNDQLKRMRREISTYMTDHGYGSRLLAGQNMAKDMSIIGDVYGKYGPGKRALNAGDLVKRYITDHGYGSRVHAGDKLANSLWAKDSVYGHYGPGKRSWWPASYRQHTAATPYGRFVTDNGPRSRLDTRGKVAVDEVAVGDLYGMYGLGRKKQNSRLTESDEPEELSEIVLVENSDI